LNMKDPTRLSRMCSTIDLISDCQINHRLMIITSTADGAEIAVRMPSMGRPTVVCLRSFRV
jgi:hypothetical protein